MTHDKRNLILLWGFLLALAVPMVAGAQKMIPTPVARAWEIESHKDGTLSVFISDSNAEAFEAMVFGCEPKTRAFFAYANFSAYPSVPTPMQLAVQRADGRVWRYGKPLLLSGGAQAGFPNYKIEGGAAEAFFDAAATAGALISNGYTSLWNRTTADDNARARAHLSPCLGGGNE